MTIHEDKLYLINLKLDFWRQRLKESVEAIDFLNELGNQVKIDDNMLYINNCEKIILSFENELSRLTQ